MVIATGIFVVLAVLFTMHEAPLSCMTFMLAGLALLMHTSLHWTFWLTAGLFALGLLVLYLELRHQARRVAKLHHPAP